MMATSIFAFVLIENKYKTILHKPSGCGICIDFGNYQHEYFIQYFGKDTIYSVQLHANLLTDNDVDIALYYEGSQIDFETLTQMDEYQIHNVCVLNDDGKLFELILKYSKQIPSKDVNGKYDYDLYSYNYILFDTIKEMSHITNPSILTLDTPKLNSIRMFHRIFPNCHDKIVVPNWNALDCQQIYDSNLCYVIPENFQETIKRYYKYDKIFNILFLDNGATIKTQLDMINPLFDNNMMENHSIIAFVTGKGRTSETIDEFISNSIVSAMEYLINDQMYNVLYSRHYKYGKQSLFHCYSVEKKLF